jgi:HK97 family phage portal protein
MASGRALVARTLRTVARAVEGAVRPGPYFLSVSGGWLPDGAPINWWQTGMDIVPSAARSAMVEACVSAYSQTVSMLPGDHWRLTGKGGRARVKNSAASRILRKPNAYQSPLDFMLNAVRQLYLEGNAYALALRNDRYEVSELHLMDAVLSRPQLAVNGEVFYRLAGNAVIAQQMPEALVVPQRDVLHIRLHADRSRQYPFPLWGQTPLLAALYDMGLAGAIAQQQQQFYMNQARPSAVIQTDMPIDKDLVQELRDRWDEQTKGLNQGKTPILTHGLKVNPWAQVPKDAQVAEVMKIAENHIALAFRVPLQILGLGGPTFGSTEALMRFWIATGLGFALECCEQAFGRLFQLKGEPDEYIEFDTSALLRSDFKDRIRGFKEAVTGGIMAPNEARNEEGFDDVPEGDMPRMQQQMIPLDFAGKLPPAGPPAAPAPAPAGPAIPAAETKPEPKPPQPKPKADDVQRATERLISNAAAINRRFLP